MSYSRNWTQVGSKTFNYQEGRPFDKVHKSDEGDPSLTDNTTMNDHNLAEETNQNQKRELKDTDEEAFSKMDVQDKRLHLGDHLVSNLNILQDSITASHNLENRLSIAKVQQVNPFHVGGVQQHI